MHAATQQALDTQKKHGNQIAQLEAAGRKLLSSVANIDGKYDTLKKANLALEERLNKRQATVDQLQKDASASCDAMSAGAIESGDVRCLVDMPTEKIEGGWQ